MQKIIYVCDRCGVDTDGKIGKFSGYFSEESFHEVNEKDFCKDCFEKIVSMILGTDIAEAVEEVAAEVTEEAVIESVQDPEEDYLAEETYPAKKKKKDSKLDMGKALALKNAGWSNEQIADELGTTKGTIAVELCKYRKAVHK